METVYDWVTVVIFAGLVVLFLQRTLGNEGPANDNLLLYLVAGVGCGLANYVGNQGLHLIAIPLIGGILLFILRYLRPFDWGQRP